MIVTSETLDRFHQHLLALQQAGFDPLATLFPDADQSTAAESSSQERLEKQLSQIAQQVVDSDRSWSALTAIANAWPLYLGSLAHWMSHGQELRALESLVVNHRISLNVTSGSRQSMLHVLIYGFLSIIALGSVWGVALGQMRQTIEQLRIQPHWSIQWLIELQPYMGWLLLLLVGGLVAIAFRLWQRHRERGMVSPNPAYNAWLKSQQAEQLTRVANPPATTLANSRSLSPESGPLLEWASTVTPDTGWQRSQALALAEQFYLSISRQSGTRLGSRVPQRFGVALGTIIAGLAGVTLFYGLVQMLLSLLDLPGGGR